MTNLEKYNKLLKEDLRVTDDELNDEKLIYNRHPHWDSLAHVEMVTDIEEMFGVQFSTIDITSFGKYSTGIEILRRLGVKI